MKRGVIKMTDEQRTSIEDLRNKGVSYAQIAEITGISRNTIKSFCRRSNIEVNEITKDTSKLYCKQCGKTLHPVPGKKKPKFCSKECRMRWWNSHPDEINRKAIYNFTCAGCGKAFTAYGNQSRKYCSHSCYINARFKDGGYSDK